MRLVDVVDACSAVAATTRRLQKVGLFADLLSRTSPDDIAMVVGLLTASPRQGPLGVGWASLAAHGSIHQSPISVLTVGELDESLQRLADVRGDGSKSERHNLLHQLLSRATADEQAFILRLISGDLRQGANEGVVAEAVAKGCGVEPALLRRAAMLLGGLPAAAAVARRGEPLDAIGLQPLTAVQPMLAGPSPSVADALAHTGPASVEWKLDGARVQVHRAGADVRVFTRSLREISAEVPSIVRSVRGLPIERVVLDGEALGVDADGTPLAFQDTMSTESTLRPFFFDVLHLDGESLIDLPLSERAARLRHALPPELRLPTLHTDDAAEAARFADAALAAGHEGVMVKALDSPYEAGRRGAAWRKVKPVHTLDLVVLAAEWGHGRRTGWLSNLHLGARGEDGTFVMVGKTFKGMTDAVLGWQTEHLQALALGDLQDGYIQHVRPELVVEIAVDGVQRSRRYPGGVALRFARLRRYRTDKTAADADPIERVQAMLHSSAKGHSR